jgi:hypothetical protein
MNRRAFLAFAHDEPPQETLLTRLQRAILGPVEHVELVIREGRNVTRYLVCKPTKYHDARVCKSTYPIDESETTWIFLRLLLEDYKITMIVAFMEEAIAKRRYFTNVKMIQASGITLPLWLWTMIIGEDCTVEDPGEPTYCSELCLLALQHVGLLTYYPADTCTPNDLRLMAAEFSEKTVLNPSIGTDSLGLQVADASLA